MAAKTICVYGSPHSGKTTIAIAISRILARKHFNVCYLSCSDIMPEIPVLLPQSTVKIDNEKKKKSIGKVLNMVECSNNDIISQLTIPPLGNLVLLGYAFGENKETYAEPTQYDIYEIFNKIVEMVDYLIVDCGSDLSNKVAINSFEYSDAIIRVGGSTYKDLVYFASNGSLVDKHDDEIVVFPMVSPKDAISDLKDFYGSIDYELQYDPEIKRMMSFGEYFISPFPKKYMAVVEKILNELNFVV